MNSNSNSSKASNTKAYDQSTLFLAGICVAGAALLARRFSAATAQNAAMQYNRGIVLSGPSQAFRASTFSATAAYPQAYSGFQGTNSGSHSYSNGKSFKYDPKLSVAFFAFGYFLSYCGDSTYKYCMSKTEVGRQSLLEAQSHFHANGRK